MSHPWRPWVPSTDCWLPRSSTSSCSKRDSLRPFSVRLSALPELVCARSSFLPPRSAPQEEIIHLAYCLSNFWTLLYTAGQQGLSLCKGEAVGDWSRAEGGAPDRCICSWASVRAPSCLLSKQVWHPSTSDGYFCVTHQCHSPEGSFGFILRKIFSYFSYPYYYSSFLLLVRNVYRLKIICYVALSENLWLFPPSPCSTILWNQISRDTASRIV